MGKIRFTSVNLQNALIIDDFFSIRALKSDFFCLQTAPIIGTFLFFPIFGVRNTLVNPPILSVFDLFFARLEIIGIV